MKVLAVIPARGGSRGIPRKNVRLLADKPLIYYAISNGQQSKYITDLVVITDDAEIKYVAENCGAEIINETPEMAEGHITLDPVVYSAVNEAEKKYGIYDIVVTLQATSPLLTVDVLDAAIEDFIKNNYDTLICVVNKPHLSWGKDEQGKIVPLYKERLSRQQLPPNYLETGAFFISKREVVKENSRFGKNIGVFEMPEELAVDIDDNNDWIICEKKLNRKKIILRCDAYSEIGTGHVYHCLTLAYKLIEHDALFVLNEKHQLGIEKVKNSFLPYITIKDDKDFVEYLKNNHVDIVVNDCLDTTKEYIKKLKQYVKKVVTIEDEGTGIEVADIVINDLYEDNPGNNIYAGGNYIALRDEFLITKPKEFNPKLENILVLFGGTDPLDLTKRINEIAQNEKYSNIKFTFILGMGYNKEEQITSKENIEVLRHVNYISKYMKEADLAITSQGRTVYELASMGTPAIVIAQNEREQKHTFAEMGNGFINLGLGSTVDDQTINNTLDWLIATPEIRKKMKELMLSKDLKNGIKNEIELILKEVK